RMQVEYRYPARGDQPPVHLTWYHSVTGPDLEGRGTHAGYPAGGLVEGGRGQLLAEYSNPRPLPGGRFRGFRRPPQTIPRSVGHHREWLQAIRTGGATTCNFDYSGALTVAVLLGNVAYRCGREVRWDDRAGRVTNTDAAAPYLRREYRQGWTL